MGARSPLRRNPATLVAGLCAGLVVVLAWSAPPALASSSNPGRARVARHHRHPRLTRAQVIHLIRLFAGSGRQGGQGLPGLSGSPGLNGSNAVAGPPTGPAGGTLAGTYPNPTLSVSGGPCPNGQALTNVSSLAALTCAVGVFSDASRNVGAAPPNTFGALTTGNDNTALGRSALSSNTTGTDNTALGQLALQFNTTGNFNTALGRDTLDGSSTLGDFNVALGAGAGSNLTGSESDNIDVGNDGVIGDSHTIRIGISGTGSGQQSQTFLAGVNGKGVDQNTPVLVGSDGKLGTAVASSARFKTDIRPIGSASDLMNLRPVTYRYKPAYAAGNNTTQYGLIAEEVARVYPALVQRGPDGQPNGVLYGELPALLLAKVQDQQRQIQALQAQNRHLRDLQGQIDWLKRHARMR